MQQIDIRSGPSSDATDSAGFAELPMARWKRWLAIAAVLLAVLTGAYAGFEYSRWSAAERLRLEAEASRQADAMKTAAEERVHARTR